MRVAASGCSALCFTIALLLCFAEPLHAAPGVLEHPFKQVSIAQAGGSPLAASRNWGNPRVAAEKQVVAEEIDRAAQDDTGLPVAVPANDEQAPRPAAAIGGDDHSVWDETSLIGKIFIGLGTLLTLASAARMFMA